MLYHYSEEPYIRMFEPRPIRDRPDSPPVVWAVDEAHALNYWLPRECPRIVYRKTASVSEKDERRFFPAGETAVVMTVESGWLDRIRTASLYEYEFEEDGFVVQDAAAGYFVSHRSVIPTDVRPAGDLLQRILQREDVELRFTPTLHALRDAVLASSIEHYSMIRLRNARI